MSRDDLTAPLTPSRLICDVTQSWSDVGGGVGTYLRHKRRHILDSTPHRHLMIVPGPEDSVTEEGRAITVTVRSPKVPASPHYRLMLRNGAVREVLDRFAPDLIECQDSYNLPWAAIGYRKRNPDTALVAGYFTDFPTVYVERPFSKVTGSALAGPPLLRAALATRSSARLDGPTAQPTIGPMARRRKSKGTDDDLSEFVVDVASGDIHTVFRADKGANPAADALRQTGKTKASAREPPPGNHARNAERERANT